MPSPTPSAPSRVKLTDMYRGTRLFDLWIVRIQKLKAALTDAKRTIAGILLPKDDGYVPRNQIVDLRIVRIKTRKLVFADAKRTIAGILSPQVDGCAPWDQIVASRIVRIKKLKLVFAPSRLLNFVAQVDGFAPRTSNGNLGMARIKKIKCCLAKANSTISGTPTPKVDRFVPRTHHVYLSIVRHGHYRGDNVRSKEYSDFQVCIDRGCDRSGVDIFVPRNRIVQSRTVRIASEKNRQLSHRDQPLLTQWSRMNRPHTGKLDIRLPAKGNSKSHGARPVP